MDLFLKSPVRTHQCTPIGRCRCSGTLHVPLLMRNVPEVPKSEVPLYYSVHTQWWPFQGGFSIYTPPPLGPSRGPFHGRKRAIVKRCLLEGCNLVFSDGKKIKKSNLSDVRSRDAGWLVQSTSLRNPSTPGPRTLRGLGRSVSGNRHWREKGGPVQALRVEHCHGCKPPAWPRGPAYSTGVPRP